MDYNLARGITTDDIYIFGQILNQNIFSRGFRTISQGGIGVWQTTGLIPLSLWENVSNIFTPFLIDDKLLNLSIGIETQPVSYSGFTDANTQLAYFRNIQLIFEAVGNSTQNGINLTMNQMPVQSINTDYHGNFGWGFGSWSEYNIWNMNPVQGTIKHNFTPIIFNFEFIVICKSYQFFLLWFGRSKWGIRSHINDFNEWIDNLGFLP